MKPLIQQDFEYAIALLTAAFSNNKSVLTVARHTKRIPELMRYCVSVCALQNMAFMSDDKSAVALCTLPRTSKSSIKHILFQLRFVLCGIGIFHVKTVLQRESRIHAHHPETPYIHLMFLGVDVQKQGKGIGSAMLAEIKELAQSMKISIVLETSTLQNIDFYTTNGFTLYAEEEMYGYTLYFFRYIF